MEINKIYQGDCLELMKQIDHASVDMILCDLPYGSTRAKWDSIIPLENLWKEYKRIIKDKRAIVLTSLQPFSSFLISTNLEWFKYTMVWEKSNPSGFLTAKFKPLSCHEDICVFSNGVVSYTKNRNHMIYNPQFTKGIPYNKGFRKSNHPETINKYNKLNTLELKNDSGNRFPRSVIYFRN